MTIAFVTAMLSYSLRAAADHARGDERAAGALAAAGLAPLGRLAFVRPPVAP